jgi:MFS family permease
MPSPHAYRALLRLPHVPTLVAAALLGRLSYGMLPLAVVLVGYHATGSFAAAGVTSGALSLPATVLAPARARLIDRAGQRRGLTLLAACCVAALCLLLVTAQRWPGLAALGAAAALAGAFAPPLGPSMRVLWAAVVPPGQPRQLQAAYAFDASAEEGLFTLGPLLVTGLVALASPQLALGGAALLLLGGTLAFVASPVCGATTATGTAAGVARRRGIGPLANRGFRVLIGALLGVGAATGVLEVALPATAVRRGSATSAGLLLGLVSAGSALGGLWYGGRARRRPLADQYGRLCGAVALALALLPAAMLARRLPLLTLAPALLLVGVAIAPTFVCAYLLTNQLEPGGEGARTEANSWVGTANNAGATLGASLAGLTIDHAGVPAALLAAAGCAAAGAVAAHRGRTALTGDVPAA